MNYCCEGNSKLNYNENCTMVHGACFQVARKAWNGDCGCINGRHNLGKYIGSDSHDDIFPNE